jgi:hypothetical protein
MGDEQGVSSTGGGVSGVGLIDKAPQAMSRTRAPQVARVTSRGSVGDGGDGSHGRETGARRFDGFFLSQLILNFYGIFIFNPSTLALMFSDQTCIKWNGAALFHHTPEPNTNLVFLTPNSQLSWNPWRSHLGILNFATKSILLFFL